MIYEFVLGVENHDTIATEIVTILLLPVFNEVFLVAEQCVAYRAIVMISALDVVLAEAFSRAEMLAMERAEVMHRIAMIHQPVICAEMSITALAVVMARALHIMLLKTCPRREVFVTVVADVVSRRGAYMLIKSLLMDKVSITARTISHDGGRLQRFVLGIAPLIILA